MLKAGVEQGCIACFEKELRCGFATGSEPSTEASRATQDVVVKDSRTTQRSRSHVNLWL